MADAKKLTCDIITPEKRVVSAECDGVIAPAFDGLMGIRPGHAPFVTQLGVGVAEITQLDATGQRSVQRFAVREGFLQVVDDKVTLLAVDAVDAASIPTPSALGAERDAVVEQLAHPKDDQEFAKLLNERKWVEAREALRPKSLI